jgi:hypothetical protein
MMLMQLLPRTTNLLGPPKSAASTAEVHPVPDMLAPAANELGTNASMS